MVISVGAGPASCHHTHLPHSVPAGTCTIPVATATGETLYLTLRKRTLKVKVFASITHITVSIIPDSSCIVTNILNIMNYCHPASLYITWAHIYIKDEL